MQNVTPNVKESSYSYGSEGHSLTHLYVLFSCSIIVNFGFFYWTLRKAFLLIIFDKILNIVGTALSAKGFSLIIFIILVFIVNASRLLHIYQRIYNDQLYRYLFYNNSLKYYFHHCILFPCKSSYLHE